MKETPLMFSTDNVKRILLGLKTQTRRVMNPQPYEYKGALVWAFRKGQLATQGYWLDHCPYGGVGDQIWVKETWNYNISREEVLYKADGGYNEHRHIWKSAMFMPKSHARLWLPLSEPCRPERLQDITLQDCIAEGLGSGSKDLVLAKVQFINEWDSLNAKRGYGWDKNLWVWVITHNAYGVRLK